MKSDAIEYGYISKLSLLFEMTGSKTLLRYVRTTT